MRGKQPNYGIIYAEDRITPADAGKTYLHRPDRAVKRDHPRGCGENKAREYSPLALNGITPADAGKTSRPFQKVRQAQDHPRGCGENGDPSIGKYIQTGSPPRMRGKLPRSKNELLGLGITPADAGKTSKIEHISLSVQDHPRGCGENVQAEQTAPYDIGSPPRMRGKRQEEHSRVAHKGITPADAGKTACLYQLRDST